MAVARQLDCRHGDGGIGAPDLNQEHYVNWVRFIRHCEVNGLCTVIASQDNNGGAGQAAPYHDQANPLGENSFLVSRWDQGSGPTWYHLVQWADSANFGNAPGNPGRISAATTDGVGVAVAWLESDASPWNGTTNDDGGDTKGATVWDPGASTLHVLPLSNNAGHTFATNKENTARVGADDSASFARAHWVANENAIFQCFSVLDGGLYAGTYHGRYIVRTGLTLPTENVCMIQSTSASYWAEGTGNVYGTTLGNGAREGGIVGIVGDGVQPCSIGSSQAGGQNATNQPNNMASPPEFEAGQVSVFQAGATFGMPGFMDLELIGQVFNTANHNTNAAASKAFMATNTIAARKYVVDWDGGAVPGTNNTRLGRQSFTP